MKKHKLALRRETLRTMQPRSLDRIVGGAPKSNGNFVCQPETTTLTTKTTIVSNLPAGQCVGTHAECLATFFLCQGTI